jgi:hypothetical protein
MNRRSFAGALAAIIAVPSALSKLPSTAAARVRSWFVVTPSPYPDASMHLMPENYDEATGIWYDAINGYGAPGSPEDVKEFLLFPHTLEPHKREAVTQEIARRHGIRL